MTHREELAALPLSQRIARVIDASGLRQDEVAERFGVARETINRWINENREPKRPNREALAELASDVYEEPISPDVFRQFIPTQKKSMEESLADLREAVRAQTAMVARILELLLAQQPPGVAPSEPGAPE